MADEGKYSFWLKMNDFADLVSIIQILNTRSDSANPGEKGAVCNPGEKGAVPCSGSTLSAFPPLFSECVTALKMIRIALWASAEKNTIYHRCPMHTRG